MTPKNAFEGAEDSLKLVSPQEIFAGIDKRAETKNARLLCAAVSEILAISSPQDRPTRRTVSLIDKALSGLAHLRPINGYAIEGLRGSGKTTQIEMLKKMNIGQSGCRITTPLYSSIIKPNRKDVYMTMFGGSGNPTGGIVDTLTIGAFHADRLARLQSKLLSKPIFIDRHWLSFYSLEMSKMVRSCVPIDLAESIVERITATWNLVHKTFILNNITVEECEKRLAARGEMPRTEREIEIDQDLERDISSIYGGRMLVKKFFDDIVFINAREPQEAIFQQIIANLK